MKSTILIVDDEVSLRESLKMILEGKYKIETATGGKEALDKILKEDIDLTLLDIRLPEVDGLEVLKRIKEIDETVPVIMITAVKTISSAVEAMKRGAYDYITKPFDIDELQALVEKAIEKRILLKEKLYLSEAIKPSFEKIVGQTKIMQAIFKTIENVAKGSSTVFIYGESGTGKELAARAIHNRSPRSGKLFVAVNCAAIPENLLESELFGHEKGAFTGAFERHLGKFEVAHQGTIFLDEISSLPLPMQGKLLRVLQEKEIERIGGSKPISIDVRVISATNRDPKELVASGKLREDLYFSLNVIPIYIPPLRERKEDIPLLAEYFLNKYNREFERAIKGFEAEALAALKSYDWPGNIRELENLVERLVVLGQENFISLEKLPPEISKVEMVKVEEVEGLTLKEALQRFESDFIKKVLEKAGGSKSKAAKLLGIHRNTLLQLEKKLKRT